VGRIQVRDPLCGHGLRAELLAGRACRSGIDHRRSRRGTNFFAAIDHGRRKRRFQGRRALLRTAPRRVWWFSASAGDKPVGETAIFLGAGVAGLFDVEVLLEHRHRGIGSALVHAALEHARRLGYRTAVLGATGMGANLYAHFGFREVCKLSFWKYGKMKQLAA